MKTIVSASILSADLCNLQKEILKAESCGCEYIHFDVMDGVFVNNISYGLPVLEAVRKVTTAVLDVHLMICEPIKYVERFAKAGADIVTFHLEACRNSGEVFEAIEKIKSLGKKVGVSIKPKTQVSEILPYLENIDMVLVMSVEPGFGGQAFCSEILEKLTEIKKIVAAKGLPTIIEVDGGINAETGELVKKAGADILVAGSYIYCADDMKKAVSSLL